MAIFAGFWSSVRLLLANDACSPARQPWMAGLLERKPTKIATVALANKTARIAWAVMTRKEVYAPAA
jgi:hypothetical protein